MKKLIIFTLLSICSLNVNAKVTVADVDRDSAWFAAQNTTIPQSVIDKQWDQFNQPPHEVNTGNVVVTRYSVNNGAKRLQPTSTHICVVGSAGGEYRRGLKGLNVTVEPRNGYWYLTAKHDSGGSNNWGTATCWNKK
ncbi:hypothetical protein GLP37_17980 [Photobacterium phosphoreum]|uniref:hypothetical protein n=1 Tax=Photobacterium phosphoreum TaxID=659 RepID=UPI001E2C3B6B|nr:hypothetical protein [Photobacterium phosphoreum]MCD9504063.1 hypothetical protein [Photobacterium phosphoreum]